MKIPALLRNKNARPLIARDRAGELGIYLLCMGAGAGAGAALGQQEAARNDAAAATMTSLAIFIWVGWIVWLV